MKKLSLFLLLVFSFPLFATIEKYLKQTTDKYNNHKIKNIDFIYIINLDQRPEKWNRSLEQLLIYGICPYRFSAVNGWELSLEAINDIGVQFTPGMIGDFMGTSYHLDGNFAPSHEKIQNYGQTYFSHCMARGAIGIVLSHLSVLQDAYDSGYERIWVMEDDIEILSDPKILPELIDQLNHLVGKNNWDILFTDQDTKNAQGIRIPCYGIAKRPNFNPGNSNQYAKRSNVGHTFRKIGARFGAYSMIIQRSGMKKILDFFKTYKIFLPYDMDFFSAPNIQMFTVQKDIVGNMLNALSDNGGPNYLHANKVSAPSE